MVFFVSWQLWEKLTFVLAMSLVGVFLAGYVKLWWITRRVRKHELDDEEKQTRIREMRESGQLVETPKETDIPFGVRAIEKGVEVPGVWINRENTPVPENLRIGHYVKRKSDSESSSRPMSAISAASVSITKGGRRAFSAFGMSSSTSDVGDPETSGSVETSSRRTYKPKHASQLRYSSYNNTHYDPATLGRLEGGVANKDSVQVRRPRGAGPILGTEENYSSVSVAENADNERSSGSSVSSDGTFARTVAAGSASASASSSTSAQAQQHRGYFAVPIPRTPGSYAANPFTTPDQTPAASDTSSKYLGTPAAYNTAAESPAEESAFPLLQSTDQSMSPERRSVTVESRFQRSNQATRHVNAGFSVFPAGTFTGTKGKEVERPVSQDSEPSQSSEKRKPNKLRKKGRFSMTGPRNSDDLR